MSVCLDNTQPGIDFCLQKSWELSRKFHGNPEVRWHRPVVSGGDKVAGIAPTVVLQSLWDGPCDLENPSYEERLVDHMSPEDLRLVAYFPDGITPLESDKPQVGGRMYRIVRFKWTPHNLRLEAVVSEDLNQKAQPYGSSF